VFLKRRCPADQVVERVLLAVHLDAEEAARLQILEELPVLALAMRDEPREHAHLRGLGEGSHLARDLARTPSLHRLAARDAPLLAGASVEDAEVVVDFGDRADGRPRVRRGALLLDGDRRREATDALYMGTLELPEELTGVRRERLEIATLSLGVERIERQARF